MATWPTRLIALGLGFLSWHCVAAPSAEESFAADMRGRLEAQMRGAKLAPVEGEPLSLHREATNGFQEGTINLHRIFGFCQNATAPECERVKSEFVRKILVGTPTLTRQSLRLMVRDAQYLDYIRQMQAQSDDKSNSLAVSKQIGDDLYAILASDSADTLAVVPPRELSTLKLTPDQAWAIAWKQTKAQLPEIPTDTTLATKPILFEGHDYGSALLIDAQAWTKLAELAGPDLFVTVVSDHVIFVGAMPDGARFTEFHKSVADDCAQQERCISPNIYRFREGRWVIAR